MRGRPFGGPGRDHHFRAPEVDVFEAHDEFGPLYAAQRPVRCEDLRPALSAERPLVAEDPSGLRVVRLGRRSPRVTGELVDRLRDELP